MSRRYSILLVTKSTGGVAEYVRWMVYGLDKRKFSLTVACLSEHGSEFAEELLQLSDVEAFSFPMDRFKINLFTDIFLIFKIRKILRKKSFDLIHAHASKPGFITRMAAAGLKIPVFYSPHGFAFHAGASSIRSRVTAFLERFAVRFTTRIIAVADGEIELAQEFGVGNEQLFVTVHTGIDMTDYHQPVNVKAIKKSLGIPSAAQLVGTVGRLSPQKSPADFIQAAALIKASHPKVHFIWIGDGPMQKDMQILVHSLELDDVFHWGGQRQDVPKLLHVFDCFMLTSRWEGFPLVILEALAAKVPVVATDILGTREAISSGVNGWLSPVGDTNALARAAIDILDNPVRATAFHEAGLKRIYNEFTREKMLASLEQEYMRVINIDILVKITNGLNDQPDIEGTFDTNLPEVNSYPYSFILRYPKQNADAILVKIPRKPHLLTIYDAARADSLRPATIETYRNMQAIWNAFADENSPDCVAIQPLHYFPKWNAIVMSEVRGTMLKNLFLHWQKDWPRLADALSRSALWLRIFHEHVGQTRLEPFLQSCALAKVEDELAALMENSREQVDVRALRARLSMMIEKIGSPLVRTSFLHDDFQYSNIMILDDGRVCALDADARRRDPIYHDLATLLIDPQTRLAQIITLGVFASKKKIWYLRKKVLSTYFGTQPVDENILDFYCALNVLHKWSMNEKKITQKYLFSIPLVLLMRFWMMRTLSSYLD
ncbi:MAG: glycosyltransferase family 4 protein [Anaerolineae bacterium]|nr:glycosyltransferase family 4 protein [Anaerolineae bacterium]